MTAADTMYGVSSTLLENRKCIKANYTPVVLGWNPKNTPAAAEIATLEPEPRTEQRVFFLDLPAEIRLQIYHWLFRMSPLDRRSACPWFTTPSYRAYFLQVVSRMPNGQHVGAMEAVRPDTETDDTPPEEGRDGTVSYGPRLLPPCRPMGSIPSAMLRSCRQIYEEAREIPFHENEFLFTSWFSSGLTAARSFVTAMEPWQRDSTRYARLEIHVKDVGHDERLPHWVDLCHLWSAGPRALRLKIELEEATLRAAGGRDVWSDPAMGFGGPDPTAPTATPGWARWPYLWIDQGLQRLRELRCLEVELTSFPLTADQKLAWCRALSERLNRRRSAEAQVSVVCVQRKDVAHIPTVDPPLISF